MKVLLIILDGCLGIQLKKSGKEPKAAAELALGATSYKTKAGEFDL